MSSQSTKPKYFCENCGEEVAANARFCPHCGKFFAAVRCPSCGYMGAATDFKDGCPRCHYAMSQEDIYGTGQVPASVRQKKSKEKKSKNKKKSAVSRAKTGGDTGSDVPTWLLVASLIVLAGLIAALVNIKS